MSSKIQTVQGYAIPPAPRHSITVHLPTWQTTVKFADRDPELMASLKNMYPRMIPHKDVNELTRKILELAGMPGHSCRLFSSMETAAECKAFVTSASRGKHTISLDDISIRMFDINLRLYAVFFPEQKVAAMKLFWMNAGVGISSRLAEDSLRRIELLHEASTETPPPKMSDGAAHKQLRDRLAELYERAPVSTSREAKVSPDDVYLYQTGMAAIYSVHKYLLSRFNSSTVLFGFAFHSTIYVFKDWGPGYRFLGLGSSEELNELEAHLKTETQAGRRVQALWAEFPSNPLLATPNLGRLRELADTYHFVLILDDTIGSVCNVDLLRAADIVVTSLTKSFSGYADVMGGSAVLNPSSAIYPELRMLFESSYSNELYIRDAEALEENSRDYLSRSTKLNNNAARLVDYLQTQAGNPHSSVAHVYYPSVSSSLPHYQAHMRVPTEEFTPAFGCLFSIEFDSVEATIKFYDTLNVHDGPHLGAHLTLALPYVRGIYGNELEWADKYNLKQTQIRISVGLEDTEILLEDFKIAIQAADSLKKRRVMV